MALQADNEGFLIGVPFSVDAQKRLVKIEKNVDLIRRAITGNAGVSTSAVRANNVRVATPSPRQYNRSADGKFAKTSSPTSSSGQSAQSVSVSDAVKSISRQAQATTAAARKIERALPKRSSTGRDALGRFTGDGSAQGGLLSLSKGAFLSRIGAAGISDGVQQIDPSIQAAQEIARPIRGAMELFGGKDEQKTWLRKIFNTLNVFRKEETAYNKAAKKSLKAIEDKPAYAGDSEGGSFLGGAMGSVVGRFVPWALGGIATGGAALAGFFTPILATVFSPVGAAIAAAGVAAWGIFTEDGRKFFADIGGKISESWKGFTDYMINSSPKTMAMVNKVSESAKSAWETTKTTVSGVSSKAKGFVADVANSEPGRAVSGATKAVVDSAKSGAEWAKNTRVGKAIGSAIQFTGSKIANFIPEQYSALANETKRTESGGNLRAENRYGYIGSYQFGADALSDVGYVDAEKWKAAKRKKISQKRFLADPSNWTIEGGKEAFLSSQKLQDEGFSRLQNRYYASGVRSGALKQGDSAEKVAGYLKAAHLLGPGGANNYFKRGIDGADANGTRASTYAAQGARAIAAVTTSMPQVKTPASITVPAVSPTPQIPQSLTSFGMPELTVNIPSQDAGQNVSDRMIAHLVSGGLGMGGN